MIPVAWGFDIVNFVWWIGIGHAGTLISAILLAAAAEVAPVDQSVRRSHDALCRRVRRFISAAASRTPLVCLLAISLPEHHGDPAAVPQPAGVGRFCGFHLFYGFTAVLVRRV